jgi:glycosyltransferase involved in cell wall biosynthesis
MSKAFALSVVIPNYNHSSFLREAVESCLNQTQKVDEIILIDDRSSDDSWEIMKDFARRFSSVKTFRNEENEGVVHCMNKGVENATGDCILFRAADDYLVPDAMFSAKEAFANQPDATIAFGETIFFQDDPKIGTKETLALSAKTRFFDKNELLKHWIPDFNLPSSACFVRKKAVLSVGGFKEKAKWHSDWLCFTTIALRDGLTFIPQPITGFRLNPQSYGNSSLMKQGSQRPVLRDD